MHLDIITPEKNIFSDDISSLTVPTTNGYISILPHHVNLLTQVVHGEITVKRNHKEEFLAITGGFLEVADNKITILADYAVRSEHIEVEKAIEARKRAEELLKQAKENVSERDMAQAEAELRRSLLEINIAQRRRRKPVNAPHS